MVSSGYHYSLDFVPNASSPLAKHVYTAADLVIVRAEHDDNIDNIDPMLLKDGEIDELITEEAAGVHGKRKAAKKGTALGRVDKIRIEEGVRIYKPAKEDVANTERYLLQDRSNEDAESEKLPVVHGFTPINRATPTAATATRKVAPNEPDPAYVFTNHKEETVTLPVRGRKRTRSDGGQKQPQIQRKHRRRYHGGLYLR